MFMYGSLLGRIAKPLIERVEPPLHSAIRSFEGDVSAVKSIVFISSHYDLNVRNSKGETPLLVAAQNKRFSGQLAMLLLEHGASVKATTPRDGNTALHWFAIVSIDHERFCTVGELLLEHRSDPNARNWEGCTPLHYAVQTNMDQTLILVLVRSGSCVHAKNFMGDSPLHLYLQNPSFQIFTATALMKKILDANDVNSKGETLLHVAARIESVHSILLIIFLLSRGADVSIKDALGENAYEAYCRAMDESNRTAVPTMQMILQGKKYANSSLHVACLFHNVEAVHRLLRLGADVNAMDDYGCPPLFYAYFATGDRDRRLATLRLLFDFGADIRNTRMIMSFLNLMTRAPGREFVRDFQPQRKDCLFNILFQYLAKILALQEKQIERGIEINGMAAIQRDDLCLFNNTLPIVHSEYDDDWLCRCPEELEAMSETEIGESGGVSFLDLLLASPKETAIYAKNKELVKALNDKKKMFPMYRGMLDAKIAKALERPRLVESAAVSLSNALIFGDPSDEFFRRTLSYCSDQDLMNVIDALDEMEPTQELDAVDEAALTAEPESSNPFDNMPKGTFDFDDFKWFYKYTDEAESVSYFFEAFDPQNYSIWFCEYINPNELKRVFMSCALIEGMYARLDKMRKASFASVCLFGTNNDSTISGIWIWRGQELAFTLCPDWQTDYKFYRWTKLNPLREETKDLVKQYFCWTGTDKHKREFNQGRIFI